MTKAEHEYYAMNSRNYYWDYAAMRNKRSGDMMNGRYSASQSMMIPRKQGYRFNVLPFELVLSESSFHMVSYNELAYLNSLAGKIQRISQDEVDRIKMLSRGEQESMYFVPVKIARKLDRALSEDYFREKAYREIPPEYYPRPSPVMMGHPGMETKQPYSNIRGPNMENAMGYPCHSETYSQDLGYKSHPRQLPIPKQY